MGRGTKLIKDHQKKEKAKKTLQTQRLQDSNVVASTKQSSTPHKVKHHCRGGTEDHAFDEKRCIKLKHEAFCPICFDRFSYRAGCNTHGFSKEDLIPQIPHNQEELTRKFDAFGLVGPDAKVRATMAQLVIEIVDGNVEIKRDLRKQQPEAVARPELVGRRQDRTAGQRRTQVPAVQRAEDAPLRLQQEAPVKAADVRPAMPQNNQEIMRNNPAEPIANQQDATDIPPQLPGTPTKTQTPSTPASKTLGKNRTPQSVPLGGWLAQRFRGTKATNRGPRFRAPVEASLK